jgi:hypothetical protein
MDKPQSNDSAWIVVVSGILLVIVLYAIGIYAAIKFNDSNARSNRECYQKLTALISLSSEKTAQWIETTILAEKHAIGDLRYCQILELVKETESYRGHRELYDNEKSKGKQNHEKNKLDQIRRIQAMGFLTKTEISPSNAENMDQ